MEPNWPDRGEDLRSMRLLLRIAVAMAVVFVCGLAGCVFDA